MSTQAELDFTNRHNPERGARVALSAPHRPEFFRLPSRGGDPYFGLTRAWYYAAEVRGDIQLVRIRARGKTRGCTLVPFEEMSTFIRSASRRGNTQNLVDRK